MKTRREAGKNEYVLFSFHVPSADRTVITPHIIFFQLLQYG